MPRKLQLESLQNEYSSILVLLDEARSINDPVGSMQLEQRIKELEEEIQVLEATRVNEASIALFFSGQPVLGSRAISADFAGKSLSQFQELVTKQYATTELGSLGQRGPVPLKDVTDLMLTGFAQGSFGFLLEELNDHPQLLDTALKETVNKVLHFINAAGSREDSDFNEAAEELHPRTLIALKEFFTNLDSSSANVRLVNDTVDLFLDEEAVHRARVRTEHTQIDEKEESFSGILLGFLPEHKKFELKIDTGEIIYGSATKESAETFESGMSRGMNIIGSRSEIRVIQRTVRSLNRPDKLVYRLLDFINMGQG